MAAPSMSEAVKLANQSPPAVAVKLVPSRLLETDREAMGMRPSSTPSKSRPRKEAMRTAVRAEGDSVVGECIGLERQKPAYDTFRSYLRWLT